MSFFDYIPKDVIAKILIKLNIYDFLSCLETQKIFWIVTAEKNIWKHLCERDYLYFNTKWKETYYETYKYWFQVEKLALKCLSSTCYKIEWIPNYSSLWLSNTAKEVSKEISILTDLKELYCIRGLVSKIPKGIGSINLTKIVITKSLLVEIPDEIRFLKNLTILDLNNNHIEVIGEGICSIENLKYLNLSYNKIRKIPKCILWLKNIENLFLFKNKILEIDEEIYDKYDSIIKPCEKYHYSYYTYDDWD